MLNIGILGGADIAYNMFLPALNQVKGIECMGVASNNEVRRQKFKNDFHVPVYCSYEEIINNNNIDIVYIPLPPALHFKWAKLALEHGKHVFLEKPSTTDYKLTKELVDLANENNLIIQENYMFQYHSQLEKIKEIIKSGRLGDIRLFKASFGFPKRSDNDFRYNKDLGGGALMDAGGYVVKLATILLGDSIKVLSAQKQYDSKFDVDVFDSVMLTNDKGLSYQGAFGMDCQYQCILEIWGSKGKLFTDRIFTAKADFNPSLLIYEGMESSKINLEADNHFMKSIEHFIKAISDKDEEKKMKEALLLQSKLVSDIKKIMEG